jgi:hypothetical protein
MTGNRHVPFWSRAGVATPRLRQQYDKADADFSKAIAALGKAIESDPKSPGLGYRQALLILQFCAFWFSRSPLQLPRNSRLVDA